MAEPARVPSLLKSPDPHKVEEKLAGLRALLEGIRTDNHDMRSQMRTILNTCADADKNILGIVNVLQGRIEALEDLLTGLSNLERRIEDASQSMTGIITWVSRVALTLEALRGDFAVSVVTPCVTTTPEKN